MPAGQPAVVWVVDDVESVRKSIAAALEAAGLAVRDYGSARAFLSDFESGTRGCLVLDYNMPEMSGLELMQKLVTEGSLPPTIVITGHGSKAIEERLRAAGALTVLDKPVDADELIAVIARTLPGTS
ncbi:MAG: response regulator transcription factor [Rhizomicrobium sp.]